MIGQAALETLWDHVGEVEEDDSFEAALRKVEMGLMGGPNQAISSQKLFTKRAQGEKVCSLVPKHQITGLKV